MKPIILKRLLIVSLLSVTLAIFVNDSLAQRVPPLAGGNTHDPLPIEPLGFFERLQLALFS